MKQASKLAKYIRSLANVLCRCIICTHPYEIQTHIPMRYSHTSLWDTDTHPYGIQTHIPMRYRHTSLWDTVTPPYEIQTHIPMGYSHISLWDTDTHHCAIWPYVHFPVWYRYNMYTFLSSNVTYSFIGLTRNLQIWREFLYG